MKNVGESAIHLKSIQEAVGFEARNMMAVPIVVRGQTFAVLELLNRVGGEDFTTADLELLDYFCGMAAKVIGARLMISWAKSPEIAWKAGCMSNQPPQKLDIKYLVRALLSSTTRRTSISRWTDLLSTASTAN